MNDANGFRELWQSQPVEKGPGARVPRFGLLEEMTVPVFAPLSPWRRVSYAVWSTCIAWSFWRDGHGPGWLHQATGWTALIVGLAGLVLALAQRDRTHEPQPEENIQWYRTALVNEFERQFRIERRILFLLCGGSIAVSSLWATAQVLERQPSNWSELVGPVLVIGLLLWGARMYRRAVDAVRSRLKEESETDL
jgi:hypothetical protein